ncbi:amino acid permease-domain-containing protein [Podospora fimiseda]|uniref:Amino acid permease-domain-containing protein n=1 Tax=Podospora fimiseda TaxID=252190 RepID=A0AAN7BML8_9PEZI|nr:amino acid permease-domain-containing protein [Podospora fimiseda]
MVQPAASDLRQQLIHCQIFFIVFSSIIGTGVFTGNARALELAGPGGMVFTVGLVGLLACGVGETISELVQLFPTPNGVFEYVNAFVDPDWAWITSIMYWYMYASVFANQMLGAAKFWSYWRHPEWIAPMLFYGIFPVVFLGFNFLGVRWYGRVETVLGTAKVFLLFIIACILWNIARTEDLTRLNPTDQGIPYNPLGVTHNPILSSNSPLAICQSILYVAFSYIGIETFAVAAFETKRVKDIASRTLYGMTYKLKQSSPFQKFSNLWAVIKVPHWALLISIIFMLLPAIHGILSAIPSQRDRVIFLDTIIEVVQLTASISCLMVWFPVSGICQIGVLGLAQPRWSG